MDLIPCLAASSGCLEPVRRDSAGPAIGARNTCVPEPILNSSIAANERRALKRAPDHYVQTRPNLTNASDDDIRGAWRAICDGAISLDNPSSDNSENGAVV
jgi:hypothetical protein